MARIVVGVDGSATGAAALRFAADEARRRHADLDVVYAWSAHLTAPMPIGVGAAYVDDVIERDRDWLESVAASVDSDGVPLVQPVLTSGDPGEALLRVAEGADLIVVGSRGRGAVASALLGSVSRHVLQHANCPVVVVPQPVDET